MRLAAIISSGALVLSLVPAPAAADWLFTPYVGGVFGGDADFGDVGTFDDAFEKRVTFGGSLAWMGAGVAGVEVDFSHTPNFFQDTRGNADFEFGDNHVTTFMGNVILGAPVGGQRGPGVRPYGVAGVGLIRSQINASTFFRELSTNDFGVNVGAGVMGFFGNNLGLRGDVRYFRSLQDNEPDGELDLGLSNFDFWRGTIGVTFRW